MSTEINECYYAHSHSHKVLVDYLLLKVTEADWHGVSEAANDIRVMEARHDARSKQP